MSESVRILIVDDHPVIRFGLRRLLASEADLEVCGEAQAYHEAISAFDRLDPDLVIVEITLGERSGLDLVRDLKLRSPRTKFLVVSLQDEKLFAERAIAAGADGYVSKGESLDQVLQGIRHIASGGIHLSQEATEAFLLKHAGGALHSPSPDSFLSGLSARELEIFNLLGRGLTTDEIGTRLCISPKTVYSHVENLKRKLGMSSRTEVIRRAVTWSNNQG